MSVQPVKDPSKLRMIKLLQAKVYKLEGALPVKALPPMDPISEEKEEDYDEEEKASQQIVAEQERQLDDEIVEQIEKAFEQDEPIDVIMKRFVEGDPQPHRKLEKYMLVYE